MALDYSGTCIVQKPIYPHLCQFRDYDIQTLSEYVMTYYVVSLKVCAFKLKLKLQCMETLCFFIAKMYEVFYVRPAIWVATVPAKDCYHSSTGEGYCNFFSFCKLLPHGQCFDSSFCQAGQNPVSFGVFNEDQKIIESKNNIHATTVNHSVVMISHCSCQTIHMFL